MRIFFGGGVFKEFRLLATSLELIFFNSMLALFVL
jgi:hypothetical protein